MINAILDHQIHFNNVHATVSGGDERLDGRARLFVDDRWVTVPYRDGAVPEAPRLHVQWYSEVTPAGVILRAKLENRGDVPLTLGAFHLFESDDSLPGTSKDDTLLVDSGGGWFAGVIRITASCPTFHEYWQDYFLAAEDITWAQEIQGDLSAGAHYSLGGMMVYRRQDEALPTWIFSFVTPMNRCTAMPLLLVNPEDGKIRTFALSCNFAGYVLDVGEHIATEEALLGGFTDPYEAIEDWTSFCAARRHVNVWTKRPPVGWLSWYGYRLEQNAADTIRTADLIKTQLAGLDFEYIQLDLGYNKRNLPGDWFEVNDHFSAGLAAMAKDVAARGFKFGIWCSPFLVAADSAFAHEHPEALLPQHEKDGKWFWEPHCEMLQLDPTHPEGEKFLRRIITFFKAQGVRYFKFDFCNRMGRTDKKIVPFNPKIIKGVELYRRGQEIIMEQMDPDDYVYWCSNLLQFGLGLGSTSMTACDIGNTGFSAGRKVEGRIESIHHFLRQATSTMSRYYLHGKMLLLNPDSLNLAPPADIEECRMRATLVTMSGGQMFLGDRFDLAAPDRLDLVRQCAPPYGQAARPVDLFQNVCPESYPQIWHLHVDTGWDEREAVSLVNGEREKTYTVALAALHLPADRTYHAWEFWEKRSLGRVKGTLEILVPYAAARLVVLVPERRHPWVLSTSFHFTQGGVELSEVKWNETSRTLSGILYRPEAMHGEIYLTAPAGYSCSLPQSAPGIYSLALTGNGNRRYWQVEWGR